MYPQCSYILSSLFLSSLYIFIFWYVNIHKHYARPFQFVRIDYVLIKTNRDHILREREIERAHCIHTFVLWWLTTQHYYTLNFGLARTSLSLTHTHKKIARSFVIPTSTWSIIRQPMIKFKSRICLVKDTWNWKNVGDELKGMQSQTNYQWFVYNTKCDRLYAGKRCQYFI